MAPRRKHARSRSALGLAWKCLWSVVGLTAITMTSLRASCAADPQDYFVPPGGRTIEMPPLTWQEKEMWDKALSRKPPDCGGACHGPLGLPEDEPFLRASAKLVLALGNFQDSQRSRESCVLKQLAEGVSGSQASERCSGNGSAGAGLSGAQQTYLAAVKQYLDRSAPRGIGRSQNNLFGEDTWAFHKTMCWINDYGPASAIA